MNLSRDFLIQHFHLEPLPVEGGMFHLHYRNNEMLSADALPPRYTHDKATANAIVYLHQPHTCSLLHRLRTDEIYHFYNGDPVTMLLLLPDGHVEMHTLGREYVQGHKPFLVVPRGVWQGSFLIDGGEWALIGCTLAPAYDDDDFELGTRAELCARYPDAVEMITRLTPNETS